MANTRGGGAKKTGRSASGASSSRRKFVVFVSLVGVMTLTSALLLALSPAPLNPGAASSLFVVDAPQQSLGVIFDTDKPVEPGRWNAIHIRHSRTASGSALTLGRASEGLPDHFLIGNGDGCTDGELQISQRWNHQQVQAATRGAGMDRCISICLVGDFSRSRPTATQMRRLVQLVDTLRGDLGILSSRVQFLQDDPSAAGVGRHFPAADFRAQLAAD